MSWRNSQWTLLEECVCNYIGRLILAPKEVALPFRDGNLATQIIDLAGRLWLTPKTAALRWLDFAARDDYQPIVVLWRQYHPFDQGLVDACFRTVKQQRNDLREAANQLRQAFPSAPFGEALQIWRKTFGVSDVDQRTFGSVVLTEAQREAIAFLETVVQKNRTISAESMREITNPESNRYFRPEWTLWPGRPLGAFVPVRRGSARHGSTVSRLATGQTEDRSNEAVEIGSINGSYEIDAFGHGVARDGSRYIVQVLSRLATQRATS